jgi:hypothetical protein
MQRTHHSSSAAPSRKQKQYEQYSMIHGWSRLCNNRPLCGKRDFLSEAYAEMGGDPFTLDPSRISTESSEKSPRTKREFYRKKNHPRAKNEEEETKQDIADA